uniref:Enoyl reductase (ER) domain-containing protein n=1 Tax=Clastoptera arizonana TaxID=38151 RepID=A0A1B6CFR2_9HEMI
MDEVLFHLNQRLEALQVLVYSLLQNGRIHFEIYSERSKHILVGALTSPQVVHFQEIANQKLRLLIEFVDKVTKTTVKIVNPGELYMKIIHFIGPEWDHRRIYTGFLGFTIGVGIGVAIGLCWQAPPRPLSYMKAVAVTSYTGTDAVALLEDTVVPTISSPDEVLIQVKAASLDPIDIKICNGYGRMLRQQLNKYNSNVQGELPLVLGRDMAGIIIDIGSGVSRLEVGDEVWCAITPFSPGTLSDIVVVKEYLVSRKPKTLGFEGAASLPYSGTMAFDAVFNKAKLNVQNAAGKKVLVHCASSGVGCLITQMAYRLGTSVTVTCLNRATPVMQMLGAENIYALETADVEKQLQRKERFDYVFNTAGPIAHQFCLNLCNAEGVVVTTIATQLASDKFGLILGSIYSTWIRIAHSIFGYTSWGSSHLSYKVLDELATMIDKGKLQPVVDKILQPHEIDRAFQHIDSAHAIGKTVIRFR